MMTTLKIPVGFRTTVSNELCFLFKKYGETVKEKEIQKEAIEQISQKLNLNQKQMTVQIFKKTERINNLSFQDNDDTLNVNDIQRVVVNYEGEPLWSCSGCKELKQTIKEQGEIIKELRQEVKELKQTVKEQGDIIRELRQEKQRNDTLVTLGEIIGELYKKLLCYAKEHLNVPENIKVGDFLHPKSTYKTEFNKSLKFFGIARHDFDALRKIKQTRNDTFHFMREPIGELIEKLKKRKTEQEEFAKQIQIIEKYSGLFAEEEQDEENDDDEEDDENK